MLDIFEIAREEGKTLGIQEGKTLGIQEGKTLGTIETTREMTLEILIERFNVVSDFISEQVRKIRNQDVLKGLHRRAVICKDLKEFEAVLKQAA